jgi:hypothetical protein
MKSSTRNIIIVGAIVLITIVLASLFLFNEKTTDLSKVNPEFTLTAQELFDAFSMDELSANEKFIGKVVQVDGNVSSIEYAGDSIVSIILMNEDQFAGIACTFQNDSEYPFNKISEGDTLTVRGICLGMLVDVLLNYCVVIENEK